MLLKELKMMDFEAMYASLCHFSIQLNKALSLYEKTYGSELRYQHQFYKILDQSSTQLYLSWVFGLSLMLSHSFLFSMDYQTLEICHKS